MSLSKTQIEIIKKCKENPAFFIEKFCAIRHPVKGIIPFKLFSYQKRSLGAYIENRFCVHKKCRQSGLSTLAGAFALWYAMFNVERTILIVSKRDKDAMGFMQRNVKFPYNNLPKWMRDLWPLTTDNDHRMTINNGSIIDSLTSSPDTLRSHSASLNIIDEAAFMPRMEEMWAGGQACCALDTQISTHIGMVSFADLLNSTEIKAGSGKEIQGMVHTDAGLRDMTHIYNNGYAETRRITTQNGYEIECTLKHRLRVLSEKGYEWKHAKSIKKDDTVCLMPNTCPNEDLGYLFNAYEVDQIKLSNLPKNKQIIVKCSSCLSEYRHTKSSLEKYQWFEEGVFTCPLCIKTGHGGFDSPKYMTTEWSECIGYFLGGGFITANNEKLSILIDTRDPEIAVRFVALLENHQLSIETKLIAEEVIEISSDCNKLINFFTYYQLGSSKIAIADLRIPPAVLFSGRIGLSAFLRGLYEAIGTVSPHDGEVQLVVLSELLSKQIQTALLSLGILSKREQRQRIDKGLEQCEYFIRILPGTSTKKFINEIGFISDRKRELADNLLANGFDNFIDHPLVGDLVLKASGYYHEDDDEFAKLRMIQHSCVIAHQYAMFLLEKHPDLQGCKIGKLLKNGMIFDKVESVTHDSTMTADLSVPDNHTYIANGFISHNTMMHGGRCIVISTCSGIGDWYWKTWMGAESGSNMFYPIPINWWDMDWTLKYIDPISKKEMVISPIAGIEKCIDSDDIDRYGPWKSPWIIEQYSQLESKGESHKFRAEWLAEFLGSGDTVIDRRHILNMFGDLDDENYQEIKTINYYNQASDTRTILDFNKRLRIWNRPVRRGYCTKCDKFADGKEKCCGTKVSTENHTYSIGVDISTGEATDYSVIQIIDITTREQVAELQIKVPAKMLAMMTDYLGRYYNNAFVIAENIGYGQALVDELYMELMYPNMYKEQTVGKINTSSAPRTKLGFTTSWTKKPLLSKALIDSIGTEDHNYVYFKSDRLYQEILTFVNLGGGKTGSEPHTGSHDDIVMATGMALFGMSYATNYDEMGLIPFDLTPPTGEAPLLAEQQERMREFIDKGGRDILPPLISSNNADTNTSEAARECINRFGAQLSGLNPSTTKAVVPNPIHIFNNDHPKQAKLPEKDIDRSNLPTISKQRHVIRVNKKRNQ